MRFVTEEHVEKRMLLYSDYFSYGRITNNFLSINLCKINILFFKHFVSY